MLQIIKVSQEHQKLSYFEQEFDQYQDLWIVNDLRSKISLQQIILKKDGFFQTESILRVQDFWRQLFLATNPEVKIVSRLFIETWIQQEVIAAQEVKSLLFRQSPSFILSLINLLSPIYFDQNGLQQLDNYFLQYPEAAARWQDLAQVGQILFNVIVKNKQWLLAEWLPNYFLQNYELDWQKVISRRCIYVDLGVDLKTSEAHFISHLAQSSEFKIFEPLFENLNKQIEYIKAPYQVFSKFKAIKEERQIVSPGKVNVYSFSTELTQLKAVVAETKKLIHQQVLPAQITWVLPDIESVWPVLQLIADQEDLIFNRPKKIKIKNYSVVSQWLSRLSVLIGHCEIHHLEQLAELNFINHLDKVSQFKNTHLRIELSEEIEKKIIEVKAIPDQLISIKTFIEIVYNHWADPDQIYLFWKIIDALYKDIAEQQSFKFSAWLEILTSVVNGVELLEKEGSDQGIQLLNLNEFNLNSSTHLFVLSLTESYLAGSDHVQIRSSEFDRLGWDYGYFLDHPNLNRKVADFQWIVQSGWPSLWLSSFHIDLKGSITAHHVKFLEAQLQTDSQVLAGSISQWDSQMKALLLKGPVLASTINKERQQYYFKNKVGVTSLNQYAICQFSGVADQIYQLKHKPDKDLDLDKRELGTLHHGVIEKLLNSFDQIQDIKDFVITYLNEQGIQSKDHPAFILFAQRFMEFERHRRQQFPKIIMFKSEMPFQIYINVREQKIQSSCPLGHEEYLLVRGKIDRVDLVDGYFVVIDYKSYGNNDFKFNKWLDSKYYQLAIYGLALELDQSIQSGQLKWGGAEIINYSKMVREGGFLLPECVGQYADQEKPRKPPLTQVLLSDFKQQLIVELVNLAQQYLSGQCAPNVLESKKQDCVRCDWRMLCRAPHLDI